MEYTVPQDVLIIINTLQQHGFEAFLVGGCVRDMLMSALPSDWDICTNALPEQVKACFSNYKSIDTGIQHGTITLIINSTPYEITTYRIDGPYNDKRQPQQVAFTSSLHQDLSRRDFTMNAIAYSPSTSFHAPYGGLEDIKNRVIRCVGNAQSRFEEDPLRILRAVRFQAVLGFSIEKDTRDGIFKTYKRLSQVSAERIQQELNRMLLGDFLPLALNEFCEVLFYCIPELAACKDFLQHNPHHDKDVWQHTITSVAAADKNLAVRLALLFHDIAKPQVFTLDDTGVGHFYGHSKASAQVADYSLKRLRYATALRSRVVTLIKHHGIPLLPSEKSAKKWLNCLGEETLQQLIKVQKADAFAHAKQSATQKLSDLQQFETIVNKVIQKKECFSIKNLAVTGSDIVALGINQGPAVGKLLQVLLEKVMDGQLQNNKAVLLSYLQENLKE